MGFLFHSENHGKQLQIVKSQHYQIPRFAIVSRDSHREEENPPHLRHPPHSWHHWVLSIIKKWLHLQIDQFKYCWEYLHLCAAVALKMDFLNCISTSCDASRLSSISFFLQIATYIFVIMAAHCNGTKINRNQIKEKKTISDKKNLFKELITLNV